MATRKRGSTTNPVGVFNVKVTEGYEMYLLPKNHTRLPYRINGVSVYDFYKGFLGRLGSLFGIGGIDGCIDILARYLEKWYFMIKDLDKSKVTKGVYCKIMNDLMSLESKKDIMNKSNHGSTMFVRYHRVLIEKKLIMRDSVNGLLILNPKLLVYPGEGECNYLITFKFDGITRTEGSK